MAGANFSEIRDLVNLDMLVTSYFWKAPKLDIIILRAAHILGNLNNAPSNYLRLPGPIPTIMGFDPMIQVIHQSDLADALIQAYKTKEIKGIFNIASDGELPISEMIKYLGKKRLNIPEPILKLALSQMWFAKISSFPAKEVDYIKYICMGDTNRSTEVLKFKPKYTITDALDSLNTLIF
jgi:UDP-glucose 4-epimerase